MNHRLLACFSLAVLSAALLTALHAGHDDFKEVITRTSAFVTDGKITLENVNGDIEIHAWDKNEILVEAEKSAKTDEELKLIELTIDLTDAKATIQVRQPKRPGNFLSGGSLRGAVRFKLRVPATVTLEKISSVNSAVTLDGIRGAVTAHSVNGALHATNLGGEAHLKTVNGAIKASFSTVVPHQKLSFQTVNGAVAVRLPPDAGFGFRASLVNGRIECDFPLALTQKKDRRNLSGTIGDGRATLHAETVNGGIRIESL